MCEGCKYLRNFGFGNDPCFKKCVNPNCLKSKDLLVAYRSKTRCPNWTKDIKSAEVNI